MLDLVRKAANQVGFVTQRHRWAIKRFGRLLMSGYQGLTESVAAIIEAAAICFASSEIQIRYTYHMMITDSLPRIAISGRLLALGQPLPGESRSTGVELSVVVPCFGEEGCLPELHRRVSRVCQHLGIRHEIVLVNDGSADRTWELMIELAHADTNLVLVNLSRNYGHQIALTAGLFMAGGRRILIIDADLQDPPELLPEMLRLMEVTAADVVYGQRRRRHGDGPFKKASASLFYRLIDRLTDVRIPRDTGDFRLLNRRALDVLLALPEQHRFLRGMASWMGLRQEPFLYDRHPRIAGKTKYSLRSMVRFALDAITGFSVRPLAFASWAGIAAGLLSCLLVAYSITSWLRGDALAGWTSLMAVTTLIGSAQLIILGIIGEYLGRMYEQAKGRPLFIIDRIVRWEESRTDSGEGDVLNP